MSGMKKGFSPQTTNIKALTRDYEFDGNKFNTLFIQLLPPGIFSQKPTGKYVQLK